MSPTFSRAAVALALPLALLTSACDSSGSATVDAELSVFATSNPGDLGQDNVTRLSADLSASQATFGGLTGVSSLQSVAFDGDGNAFLTVDLPGTLGGIVYAPALCDDPDDGCTNAGAALGAGARVIAGASTGLVAPKGLVVTGSQVIVADVGAAAVGAAGAIRVFSASATGNTRPDFVVTNLGAGTSVWDVAYDDEGDRLFVASTNGLVLVYDDFFEDRGATGPDRTILLTDGTNPATVNLHGIVYDRERDLLVVSDVGSAASATDGQLFTIASASTATGATVYRARVAGAASRLGNPVDLALTAEGAVYVAEKSNSLVMRYDTLLTATGSADAAAAASIAVPSAESVALVND